MAFATPSDPTLRALSVSELAERCMSEINASHGIEPHDARYCAELFRRALEHSDAAARGAVEHCFHEMMLGWLRSHPQRAAACVLDREERYVAQGFARFWQATDGSEELVCQDLASALGFLRASMHGALLEALRVSAGSRRVTSSAPADPTAPGRQIHGEGPAVWEIIQRLVPNEREQRAAYLLFHCGLKPGEIIRSYPETFSDVQELYRLYGDIAGRLLGQAALLTW